MKTMNIEPHFAKGLGIAASYGILVLSSTAYAVQAGKGLEGLDQASASGMAALPGVVALGALAAALSASRRRQIGAAALVGCGALAVQCINANAYWLSRDAGVQQAKANVAEARKVEAKFQPTPSQPIRMQIRYTVETGGPKERRAIRAEKRELVAKLAAAEQSEAMKTSLKARVVEAEGEVVKATQAAGFTVWAKTLIITAIEALGPASMALSAKGRLQPQPQPQPAPKPVNPASNLAHMGWSGERGQKRREALRKAKPLNEAAI